MDASRKGLRARSRGGEGLKAHQHNLQNHTTVHAQASNNDQGTNSDLEHQPALPTQPYPIMGFDEDNGEYSDGEDDDEETWPLHPALQHQTRPPRHQSDQYKFGNGYERSSPPESWKLT